MAYRKCQVILDGVCSVASELIKMDEWGIDVVMTASQKGLGTPPGLSILVASNRAIKVRLPTNVSLVGF
jgi:alanine-glyoxylate transaminase/serine-glyoxylate transaminase/serine-pyruvate transaminase